MTQSWKNEAQEMLHKAVHDLSQPMMGALFALEIGSMDHDAASRTLAMETALEQCRAAVGRMSHLRDVMSHWMAGAEERTPCL